MVRLVPSIHAPFLAPTQQRPVRNIPKQWGVSPLFDFKSGEFFMNESGGLVVGNEAQTLIQWCRKSLLTQQNKWKAYTGSFGNPLIGYLGIRGNDGILAMIAKTSLYNCLIVHDCIKTVSQPQITQQADQLYGSMSITTVAGHKSQLNMLFQNS